MRVKDVTVFTVASQDAVLGWEIETEFNEVPQTKSALDGLVSIIGMGGIESFLDYAMSKHQKVEIIISNEYGSPHSLEFDPFSAPKITDPKHDTEFVLFMTMLSACLSEFLQKLKEEDGKALS